MYHGTGCKDVYLLNCYIDAVLCIYCYVLHDGMCFAVSWPPYVNLSNPDNYGLHGARSFRLDMASGISLGVWSVGFSTKYTRH